MEDGGVDNIFVYLGGEQEVPDDVTHVIIDRSVKIIPKRAFYNRGRLVSVEMHDGVEIIEHSAFGQCTSLRGIKLSVVVEVGNFAFYHCEQLADVEFGNKLETIGQNAFSRSTLGSVTIPSARTIGHGAFSSCEQLTEVELPVVEAFGRYAFYDCLLLQRIAIPLKDNLFALDTEWHRYTQFDYCENLTTVDLVGIEGIHKTISSLLLESWRSEMNQEINRINQVLPNTRGNGKTVVIRLLISSVTNRMEQYKAEHCRLLKEATTLLELALWKAKLDEKKVGKVGDDSNIKVPAKKAKIDVESMRKEKRTMSGADVILAMSSLFSNWDEAGITTCNTED